MILADEIKRSIPQTLLHDFIQTEDHSEASDRDTNLCREADILKSERHMFHFVSARFRLLPVKDAPPLITFILCSLFFPSRTWFLEIQYQ